MKLEYIVKFLQKATPSYPFYLRFLLCLDFSKNNNTAQKTKFSIKDFFSKCDQISSFLRIWSHLLKKSLMENFFFCTV